MKDKKNIIPMVIAAIIALGVTVVARLLIPGEKDADKGTQSESNVPMPDIPLMIKETKKVEEVNVLVADKEIKKGSKIGTNVLTWKKWPKESLQSNFIAKDLSGTPLNNGGDYRLALTMWAGTDIMAGVPVAVSMLLSYDPIKKEQEEQQKKVEEENKKKKEQEIKKQEKIERNVIHSGMRAITFPIDQKSASSLSMLKAGDLVDVLISEQRDGKTKMHKYRSLKILAIDGSTDAGKKQESKGLGSISNSFLTPKNVTLEIKESLVETMLKQSSSNGVILSLKNQDDKDSGENEQASTGSDENIDMLFQKISSISRMDSARALIEAQEKKDAKHKVVERFIQNMNMTSNSEKELLKQKKTKDVNTDENKYEFVQGRVVGTEKDAEKNEETKAEPKQNTETTKVPEEIKKPEESVTIYRQLTSSKIVLDEDGKKKTEGSSNSSNLGINN